MSFELGMVDPSVPTRGYRAGRELGSVLGDIALGDRREPGQAYYDGLKQGYGILGEKNRADKLFEEAGLARDRNVARAALTSDLFARWQAGDAKANSEIAAAIIRANPNPTLTQYTAGALQNQEFNFRQRASDAAIGELGVMNGNLVGLENGPIELSKIDDGVRHQPYMPGSPMEVTPVGAAEIATKGRTVYDNGRNAFVVDKATGGATPLTVAPSGMTAQAGLMSMDAILGEANQMSRSGKRTEAEIEAWIQTAMSKAGFAPEGTQEGLPPIGSAVPGRQSSNRAAGVQGGMPKLSEQQSKDLGYLRRGRAADALLAKVGDNLTMTGGEQGWLRGTADQFVRGLPWVGDSTAANMAVSSERQQAEQAGREFLASILRKDTGAAFTAQELETYEKMYLPQPGDSDATLKQKATARKQAMDAIEIGLGPAGYLAKRELGESDAPVAPVGGVRRYNPATGRLE